jgi:hypothetical protein
VRSEYSHFVAAPLKRVYALEGDTGRRRHIALFEALNAKLPIERVIVGPSRHQNDNFDKARSVIGKNLSLSCSATPYIG